MTFTSKPLSNAQSWSQICQRQAELLDNLSTAFPERTSCHLQLSNNWRKLGYDVDNGLPITEQSIK